MLICTFCGSTYEGELSTSIETHGHTSLGNTFDEEVVDTRCPICLRGELVEAKRCSVCGDYFYDEHNYNVCDECLDKNKTFETALAIGDENETDIYINGFLKSLLGEKKIKEILVGFAKIAYTDAQIKKEIEAYCDEDKDYFAEWVEYEANTNERG